MENLIEETNVDVCCNTVFAHYPEFFKVEHVKQGMQDYLNDVGLSDNITEPKWNGEQWQAEIIVI